MRHSRLFIPVITVVLSCEAAYSQTLEEQILELRTRLEALEQTQDSRFRVVDNRFVPESMVAGPGEQEPDPTARKAAHAANADYASQAGYAARADHATHADHAANADHALIAQQALVAERANSATDSLPVGSVIMWWGNLSDIPRNWELCDGGAPTTPGAAFSENKPDLRDRFLRGSSNTDLLLSDLTTGGNDSISINTGDRTLTVDQMPSHTHTVGGVNNLPGGNDSYLWSPSGTIHAVRMITHLEHPQGKIKFINHTHSMEPAGKNKPHNHSVNLDNKPSFQQIFFIIRVN
jgi:hypothetical protein